MRFLLLTLCTFLVHQMTFAQTEAAINKNIFKVAIKYKDLSQAHGIDPVTTKRLRTALKDQAVGSSFVYQKEGIPYIITCMHVVEMAKKQKGAIIATNTAGDRVELKVLGGDTFLDIAVLKFAEGTIPQDIKGFSFNSQSPKRHEDIFALGWDIDHEDSPQSKKGSHGGTILDFKDDIGGYGYIRIDNQLVPGMSGGPVFNRNNKIVGVNARARTSTNGVSNNMGYLLDGVIAKRAIDEIIENRKTNWILNAPYFMIYVIINHLHHNKNKSPKLSIQVVKFK